MIELRIKGMIAFHKQNTTPSLGGQLIDGVIDEIRQHAIMSDHIIVNTTLTVPAPFNNLDFHQQIVI